MKFPDIYQNAGKPVISFEVFPAKTPEGKKNLLRTLDELAGLAPDFISVTYGAMGTTRENSFETASHIKKMGLECASHLTCVEASSGEIDAILKDLRSRGIENIVALRGDPPAGETRFVPARGGYTHASELVSRIRNFEKTGAAQNSFGIAVAGYPEKHIEAKTMDEDIANLAKKIRAGADAVITQLFYDNSFYFDFADKVKRAGITAPLIPGLMPAVSTRQVMKITSMCGSAIPPAVMRRLEECERKGSGAEQAGIEICAEQAADLLSRGARGIHFYVLNRASPIKSIMKKLGI